MYSAAEAGTGSEGEDSGEGVNMVVLAVLAALVMLMVASLVRGRGRGRRRTGLVSGVGVVWRGLVLVQCNNYGRVYLPIHLTPSLKDTCWRSEIYT